MTTSSTGPDEEALYPYHFHIVPALSNIARGIADFLNFHGFGWRRVVVITQDQNHFKKVTSYICASSLAGQTLLPSWAKREKESGESCTRQLYCAAIFGRTMF